MPEAMRPAWICAVCGHEWLKSEKEPTHCASSKCRSRRWNGGLPPTEREKQAQAWKDLLHDHDTSERTVEYEVQG